MSTELILFVTGALLLMSLVVGRFGGRVGMPSLLLFLAVGMLAGSDGLGIEFQNYALAQAFGTSALCLILFQGGLDTNWAKTRPVIRKGISLATLGVLLTAGAMAAFGHFVLGFSPLVAWLLGAIVSSTDASAVFSVLKERALGLRGEISPLLEFESGGNDPMAVFLTIGLLELMARPEMGVWGMVPLFFKQMLLGALVGYVLGRLGLWLINHINLQLDGLYPVLTIAVALTVFGAAGALGGSGFLAIYTAGVLIGNSDFIHKRSLLNFHDGLSWLMQVGMFLTLGLLVNPHELLPNAALALGASLFLVFVARPVGVYVSLALANMPLGDKSMVAWVGLRGAVPIVLATFPLLAGLPEANMLFNIVFFIVLTSVFLQATTLSQVAKWLGVREELPVATAFPISYMPTGRQKNEMVELEVMAGSEAQGRRILDLHLPSGALVILIHRAGEFLVPKGATELEAGDGLLVLASEEDLQVMRSRLQQKDIRR